MRSVEEVTAIFINVHFDCMAAETKRKATLKAATKPSKPKKPKATKATTNPSKPPKATKAATKDKLVNADDDILLDSSSSSSSSPDDSDDDNGDAATWGGTLGSPVNTRPRRQTGASDEDEAEFGSDNDMPNKHFHFMYGVSEGPAVENKIKDLANDLDLASAHAVAKTCSVKIGTRRKRFFKSDYIFLLFAVNLFSRNIAYR